MSNWPENIVIAVAANKSDLIEKAVVDNDVAEEFISDKNGVFIATSAKENVGIT